MSTEFEVWYENAIWGNEDFKAGCWRAWDESRAALAQRADEPVAWLVQHRGTRELTFIPPRGNWNGVMGFNVEPLYTAAPAYVLLSSQEMQDAIIDWYPITSTEKLRFARHIESLVVARMRGEGK